jgi:uncharacterized protein (TIGR04540 family)
MIVYYKNQTLTAKGINGVIDKYWAGKINEDELDKELMLIINNNHSLVFRGKDFTPVIRQRVGKKRIRVLNEVLGRKKNEEIFS